MHIKFTGSPLWERVFSSILDGDSPTYLKEVSRESFFLNNCICPFSLSALVSLSNVQKGSKSYFPFFSIKWPENIWISLIYNHPNQLTFLGSFQLLIGNSK